ncbi:type IV toxin-antitoxin system AbiEi family antitoxin domain-containing protein [Nocardioides montaniterrae]
MDEDELARLLRWQGGVIARRQLIAVGAAPHDIARLVRRRVLTPLGRAVYLDHSGPLSRDQREWAAVLALWPAALAGRSALGWDDGGIVEVAVDWSRRVAAPSGVRLSRVVDLAARVSPNAPPRLLPEEAVLDLASDALRAGDAAEAFAILARGRDRAPVGRMRSALRRRSRVAGRALLDAMLDDVAGGTHSVLERGFVTEVLRPHGLPVGERQAAYVHDGRRGRHDLRYDDLGLVVQLDGYAWHGSARARDADAGQDLSTLARSGDVTVRLTYGQVFRTPCVTAARLGGVFVSRGWNGEAARCPRCG